MTAGISHPFVMNDILEETRNILLRIKSNIYQLYIYKKKEHISNPSTHGTKIYSWSISQSDTATASPPQKKHLIPWFGGGSDFGM